VLIVKKFGGTSVGNRDRIFNVANRCVEEYKKGNDVVVVLSAMGKYTDVLIDMAKEINPNPPKREMDMLLTTGEQQSVALMAMAMASMGFLQFHLMHIRWLCIQHPLTAMRVSRELILSESEMRLSSIRL
jgi:aspartokinase